MYDKWSKDGTSFIYLGAFGYNYFWTTTSDKLPRRLD